MITAFFKIRTDDKVIDESMHYQDMLALGWSPCLVNRVRWLDDGKPVELNHEAGVLAKVLRSRIYVAALMNVDATGTENRLRIFNADGTLRHTLSNTQYVGGLMNADEPGSFGWFEDAPDLEANAFRIAFEPARNNAMFMLDVDATTGRVIGNVQKR